MRRRVRRFVEEWRPSAVTMGKPAFPLLVLFGLNAADELDRTAFAVLLPEIRDHFGMTNAGILSVVALTSIAILLLEIPLSFYCDRHNRVRIATVGAAMWALFSVGTGLAVAIPMLIAMRLGAGTGRAIVTPTHNGLLSDWYPPAARLKVFSFHRIANSIGQIVGPALAGVLALYLGWRAPFFLFAIPTIVLVLFALRLKEPVRGMQERLAAGADQKTAEIQDTHESVWATMKVLARVRTLRRIWYAVPFLAVALFGIGNLLSIVYEEVFGLNTAQRGLIAAFIEPLQLVGVLVAMPRLAAISERRPDFLLRFIAIVGVFDGVMLVVLAYAPNVATAVAAHAIVAATIGTLAPAFFVMLSLVAPPRCRSAAFSTVSVFGIPGIAIVLPLIGGLADRVGAQAAMLTLVPVSVIAGFLLSRAAPFVEGDIAAVRAESLARVTESKTEPEGVENP
ncbi:MAG TPA: MFS transporter [Acidimicrobiales bacterium]|nr:MFS transporter [Acidimicrobiales bacterium]